MRRRGPNRAVAAAIVLCLLAAGCGSRRSHDEIVSAAGGATTAQGQSSDGLAPGAGSAAGDGSSTESGSSEVGGASTDGSSTESQAGEAGEASTDGDGAATGAASVGAGAGAPKSVIRIGVVGSLSGPAGASLKPIADGVRIWARSVTDRGGVNGHPIEVLVADDGGDPARHRALVQEFVEQKKVIAFVGNPEALTGASSVEYLTKAGVPVIGSEGAGQYFYESPVYFPQGSHGTALGQSSLLTVAAVAKPKGFTKVATITCLEVQVCRDAHDTAVRGFAKHDMEVVYQAESSIGQPDFTAECLNAQREGAQVITIGMDANAIRAIAQACTRQGYKPLFSWTTGSTIDAHAADPNLDGSLVASAVSPWTTDNTPGRKEFRDAMAKYAKGVTPSGGHMMGWVSGKVFELGGKALGEPATSKQLLDGLWGLHGDLLPDLTGPLLFSPGKPATPTVCGFGVTIAAGKFIAVSDAARACADYDPSL